MSSLSILSTNSFKRPFRAEDQGPEQKKQKVSLDAEVIACLANTICQLGDAFFSEDDDNFENQPCMRKAIEAGDSDYCKFMKPDLSDILGVSDDVDTLYTEVLVRLKETSTRKLEKVEVKASENIPSDSAAGIKKLAKIVSKWVEHFASDGHDPSSRIVVRILTESSKLNSKLDGIRESHLAASLIYSENNEPVSSNLDPESDKLREWNINKYLDNTDEVEWSY